MLPGYHPHQLPLRAHTWLLRLRTLLEWSAVFGLLHVLKVADYHP
tara:strand:- start:314 stop:448 length:135 start_codon:yes stop_codon:yes gene_type:complete